MLKRILLQLIHLQMATWHKIYVITYLDHLNSLQHNSQKKSPFFKLVKKNESAFKVFPDSKGTFSYFQI